MVFSLSDDTSGNGDHDDGNNSDEGFTYSLDVENYPFPVRNNETGVEANADYFNGFCNDLKVRVTLRKLSKRLSKEIGQPKMVSFPTMHMSVPARVLDLLFIYGDPRNFHFLDGSMR